MQNMIENAVFNQNLQPSSPQHRLDKKKGVSGECSSTSAEVPLTFPKQSKPIKYDVIIYFNIFYMSKILKGKGYSYNYPVSLLISR